MSPPAIWWTNVRLAGWEQFLTFQPHTLFLFPFPLGRGLADQQLDVGHIVGPIGQNLHKTKFKEHFQSPFHRPYLMAGEGSDGLVDHLLPQYPILNLFQLLMQEPHTYKQLLSFFHNKCMDLA